MKRSRFKPKHSKEERAYFKSIAAMVRQVRENATGKPVVISANIRGTPDESGAIRSII